MHLILQFFLLVLLFTSETCWAKERGNIATDNEPVGQGNLALPISQQPSPFFSFGQNIIAKGLAQLYFTPSYTRNKSEYYIDMTNSFLYGLSDDASIFLTLPVAADYYSEGQHASGFADASVQLEYGFWENDNSLATFVTALSLPTGSYYKTPQTGLGAPSYFIGSTYNQTLVNWMWFVSPGILVSSPKNNIYPGTDYLYQIGIGRNFHSVPNEYIFSGLLEFDGDYVRKDKSFGSSDPDTGGNTIFVTPSLWFSTKELSFQLGISLPLLQHLNGVQNKNKYIAAASIGWNLN
jgi:hypothetical protein